MTAVPVRPPVRTEPLVVGGWGKHLPATRSMPARWSPRPARALYATWRASKLRQDLVDRLLLLGVMCAVLLAFRLYPQQITDLMFTLLGGAK